MSSGSRRAVFLDRDGVINDSMPVNGSPLSPASLDELLEVRGMGPKLLDKYGAEILDCLKTRV